jgi:hypothetical protein
MVHGASDANTSAHGSISIAGRSVVQEVKVKQIGEQTLVTAEEPGIDNRMVNNTETRVGLTAHAMVRVHGEEEVGVALAVMVRNLYMSRLGTLRGLSLRIGRPHRKIAMNSNTTLTIPMGLLLMLLQGQPWVR